MVLFNQAVEHNAATVSDFSLAVRWLRGPSGDYYYKSQRYSDVKLLTPAARVDNLVEECQLNRGL